MTRIGDDRLLNFNHGLTGVRHLPDMRALPAAGPAPATNTRPQIQLDALFDRPGFSDLLDEATAPAVPDASLLEPAAFASALDGARDAMLSLASTHRDSAGDVFSAALSVLDDHHANRSLLDAARNALIRG